ncbi:EF-hand calcium-binding domain-containing protein 10 isoform X2 [Erinaceus europaeus]|uniref:EF-hand calcium-binding domain-containing protein 10 isoform X2 n=1 Tax=Erinaceus europaeus TaxID=9365 RepID=A0ABM3XU74_ERIEU|nr:EF-hand calcium-binding domain-containing protein 10 isoform X2 [Erinaceus europaeus]
MADEFELGSCTWQSRKAKNPRNYLIALLERIKIAKLTGATFPNFMDHINISSMFGMMDTSNTGTISFVQYTEVLKTLGLCTEDEVIEDDGSLITLEKFSSEVNKRTQKIWSAF